MKNPKYLDPMYTNDICNLKNIFENEKKSFNGEFYESIKDNVYNEYDAGDINDDVMNDKVKKIKI